MRRTIAFVVALVGALLLAAYATRPPPPQPATAPATDFSADRAMADVRVIAARPHVLGSAENARVTAYLAQRLRALGLGVSVQHFTPSPHALAKLARWSGRDAGAARGANVIGVLPGRDRAQPAVLLLAHHDTVWGSPGAADDTAGVAAILEIVRAIRHGGQPARDVIVLFSDGEELGLEGAKAFFAADPLAAHVGVVVNLETRGAAGRAMMFETGPQNGGMMRLFAAHVAQPSATSIAVLIYHQMPNSTDLTVALKRGLPGFNFAPQGGAALYHSPLATPDRLDRGTLQDMGAQGLGIARALATVPALPARAPDLVFSDVLGTGFLLYPGWDGWLLVAAAAGLFAVAVATIRPGWRGIGRGALNALWLVPHGALLLLAVNLISGAGEGHNYYDRLAALPRLEGQALLLGLLAIGASVAMLRPVWPTPRWVALLPAGVLAVLALVLGAPPAEVAGLGIAALLLGWFACDAPISAWSGWLGAIFVVLILTLAVQALAPTAAPILAWPLLLATLGAAIAARIDPALARWPALVVIAVLAIVGGGQILAFAHFAMLSVGAELAEAMVVFALLMLILLRPLIALPARAMVAIGGGLAAAALVLAFWVLLDPLAPSVAVYSVDKR